MAEPMTLRDEEVGRIGEYVKPWLRELVEEMVPHVELGGVGAQLLERMVRVEEELRAQRMLMDERFTFMAQRFEAADKRFAESIAHSDQRFEAGRQALCGVDSPKRRALRGGRQAFRGSESPQ